MKHSSQGMIPKDWSVQSIEEFVDDMKNGGTPKRGESDYWDNGTVPWLKTGEINNNIIIKSEEHITELGLKNSSAKLLPINSIIMALYGKGTAARIGLLKFEATTNQACCAMICNDFNKTLFLYLFLLFNQKEIENLASGSVQQNLSKDLIANLELVVPPIEIIDNLPFKEIFDTIANNYFEIEYLINLRDTLLPKLMSGEIDVSKINCDLELKYNYMKYLFNQIHTPMSKSVV
jgi:type I restriction enzyme S subunit